MTLSPLQSVARSSLRIGAVSYLNTKPLVYGLANRLREFAPRSELLFDLPSRLADQLDAGVLDIALIPSIEYFRNPAYEIVSNACIACRGPVLSVKLYSRRPLAEIRSLGLDEGSRTSVALARILLARRLGVRPQLISWPIGEPFESCRADAVLVIGDRAMRPPPGRFEEVWDLGDEWRRETGLPFVFAMWVARAGVASHALANLLNEARDDGLANLSHIAAIEAPHARLSQDECLSYFRDNLHFILGQEERRALDLFQRYATQLVQPLPAPSPAAGRAGEGGFQRAILANQ
jgi:chorismate dehydratase